MAIRENFEPVVPATDVEIMLKARGLNITSKGFVFEVTNGNGRAPELIGGIDDETGDFVPNDFDVCQGDARNNLEAYLGTV